MMLRASRKRRAALVRGPEAFLPRPPQDRWEWLLRLAIVAGLATVFYLTVSGRAMSPVLQAIERHGLQTLVARPSVWWISMGVVLLVFRTTLWFRYRPFELASAASAPRMSVIIPAYNEGAMVSKAIDSVAAAHYPAGCLEIIVIDDGSTDDTWVHICAAVARHAGRVKALRAERNGGKRQALGMGFRHATGDVFVTVDSDSVIEPDALLALAGPFVHPRVGAVAGRVVVYNRGDGLIPRMVHVRFVLAFDFLRAYQSMFGTVYCTPGALSAYRASVVRAVLEGWLNQRFFNVRATFGEDRALTNDILAQGYDSVYQRAATVSTIVPVTYVKLCRMYLRWNRSFIREELRFIRILWSRPPRALVISLIDVAITDLRLPVIYISLGLLVLAVFDDPFTLVRLFAAMALMAGLMSLYYLRSERSLDFLYGILYAYFSFFFLFWIFPYAVLTARRQGWLTR